MLVTEPIIINGMEFVHNYSNEGFYIERAGVKYSDAIDPIGITRTYKETDELIPIEEPVKMENFEEPEI